MNKMKILSKNTIARIATLLFLIMTYFSFGQPAYDYLDINNVKALINADGLLFTDLTDTTASYEIPKGENKHTILASSLWIGGFDPSNNLHAAANTYKISSKTDFWSGPLDTINGTAANPADWNKVWKVDLAAINNHMNNYSKSGYITPPEIINWPGNGPPTFNKVLAPFVDFNQNKIYEPSLGDYPYIFGDQAIYFIFNDNYGAHTETGALPLGIEIHGMAYAFNKSGHLNNTIFVKYRIKNRSLENYDSLYVGIWTDFDIGYPEDDYVGCDSSRNMYFGYNGDTLDEGVNGYGLNPPAQAVVFLNQKLTNVIYYDNNQSNKGIPTDQTHFYNYLSSNFKNGQKMRYGGDGFNNIWEDHKTNYMFPANPNDPYVQWSEVTAGNPPGNRRGLGSFGPISLEVDDIIQLEIAYVWGRSSKPGNFRSVDTLYSIVDEIRQLYDDGKINSVVEKKQFNKYHLEIYPNPARNNATILFENQNFDNFNLQLLNLTGQLVFEQPNITTNQVIIDCKNLATGIYLVLLQSKTNLYKAKLIVK